MAVFVDIEKNLGKFHLKIKFHVKNETLSLLGASGCGKTMTLKCIAGIEKPDKGQIVIDEKVVFDSEKGINLTPQERKVGLLFQNYALFPDMTVLQNICAGAKREKDRIRRKERVQSVIDSFGLADLITQYPRQLSGGQQQRVALARILVSAPDVLLLDEPFSALDHHLRFQMEEEVRQVIRDFGKTVIFVSHDRDEVFRMTDQIAVMNDGMIEVCGEKQEVFKNPCTIAGARLTGCKNISRIKMLDKNRIVALDWGIELITKERFDAAKYVGIRMHDIAAKGTKNIVHCFVEEEIENPFSFVVMLSPCDKKDAKRIGWEMEKEKWKQLRSKEIDICLEPEVLLPLN